MVVDVALRFPDREKVIDPVLQKLTLMWKRSWCGGFVLIAVR
jgi:hypothetical protein